MKYEDHWTNKKEKKMKKGLEKFSKISQPNVPAENMPVVFSIEQEERKTSQDMQGRQACIFTNERPIVRVEYVTVLKKTRNDRIENMTRMVSLFNKNMNSRESI